MADMTPADIRAVVDGEENGGIFGGCGMWVFALLILLLIGNGGFFGNNETANDALQQEVLYNQHFNALDNKIDGLSSGIADATYAINNSVLTEGRALQTQVADCCCTTQRNLDSVRYDNLQNTNTISAAVHAEGEATRALIKENEIQSLRDKVQALELAQATATTVKYPTAMSYAYNANPFCSGGCGCNYNI